MARAASCAALVLGLGCGQTGGTSEGGETGESTATSADTNSGSTALTGSGGPTETAGSEGQTESATGETTTTSTSGETTTTSTSGETTTTSTSGETTTTASTTAETTTTSTTGPDTTGETSTGANLCDDFEQPGCIEKGCPDGQICEMGIDCVPSACSCDPVTQQIACTPDCGGGTCVVPACLPVICDLFCEFGFQKDEQGCEVCACNEPPGPGPDCGCETDADCVKASPGCCSCNMGGSEVAVAAACVDQLEPCPFPPGEVACPAVYLCTDAQAVCVQGECVLQ